MSSAPDWRRLNRANWDELVSVHLGPRGYDLTALRAGHGRLHAIEEAELPPLAGKRVLHLQCHFGADSLTLAQRGAEVVGLDFSPPAIAAARSLADELGLSDRARFVEADVYAALAAVPEPHGFDLVYVTWGAISWLPDIVAWAKVVAAMLAADGALYLADAHPFAYVFDDTKRAADGMPGFFAPYSAAEPVVTADPRDYADPEACVANATTVNWNHPLGSVVSALIAAGLTLDWLHEHDALPWRMFEVLARETSTRLFRWPDRAWLPLAFSLSATRR